MTPAIDNLIAQLNALQAQLSHTSAQYYAAEYAADNALMAYDRTDALITMQDCGVAVDEIWQRMQDVQTRLDLERREYQSSEDSTDADAHKAREREARCDTGDDDGTATAAN